MAAFFLYLSNVKFYFSFFEKRLTNVQGYGILWKIELRFGFRYGLKIEGGFGLKKIKRRYYGERRSRKTV